LPRGNQTPEFDKIRQAYIKIWFHMACTVLEQPALFHSHCYVVATRAIVRVILSLKLDRPYAMLLSACCLKAGWQLLHKSLFSITLFLPDMQIFLALLGFYETAWPLMYSPY
jgi:hypothetical protein